MSVLDLDPNVLESTATIIEEYCRRQAAIMDDYLANASSLSYDWTDDKTLGTMLEEIKVLRNRVMDVMNDIRTVYPRFFREKAELIRQRPSM